MGDSRWVVAIDGHQLDGEHSVEETKALIRKNQGKRILVWTQGMSQWADPAEVPEFREPAPTKPKEPPAAPARAAQPSAAQPSAPAFASVKAKIDKEEIKKQASFFKALLDFRFESFVTGKLIPILYVIVMILIGLAAVGYFFVGGGGMIFTGIKAHSMFAILGGILIMIFTPIVAIIYLSLVRVWFELVIILFRMKEDLTVLVDRARNTDKH